MHSNRLNRLRAGLLVLLFGISFSVLACTPAEPPPKIDTETPAKTPTVPAAQKVDPVK